MICDECIFIDLLLFKSTIFRDTAKIIVVLCICGLRSALYGQSQRICYIPDSRSTYQDHGYTLDGRYMRSSATSKMLNRKNFGPNGVVPHRFEIKSLDTPRISRNTIAEKGCSIVFLGRFYDPKNTNVLNSSEIEAIRSWSLEDPSHLVIVAEHHSKFWGYEYVNDSSRLNYPTPSGAQSEIFNGPFGSIGTFEQGGAGYGYLIPNAGKPLAVNSTGSPTIFLDLYSNDIILADIDLLTSLGGISPGKHTKNSSDILFCNFWAYISHLSKNRGLGDSPKIDLYQPDTKKKNQIKLSISFDQSSSSLLPSEITRLDSLMRIISRRRVPVVVHGYSDVIGDSRSNLTLSKRRARSVRKYLISNGIKRRRITLRFFGSLNPVYRGSNSEERVKNRRVEILVDLK